MRTTEVIELLEEIARDLRLCEHSHDQNIERASEHEDITEDVAAANAYCYAINKIESKIVGLKNYNRE